MSIDLEIVATLEPHMEESQRVFIELLEPSTEVLSCAHFAPASEETTANSSEARLVTEKMDLIEVCFWQVSQAIGFVPPGPQACNLGAET